MARRSRSRRQAIAPDRSPPPAGLLPSLVKGTGWWWTLVGAATAVGPAWRPLEAAIGFLHDQPWGFPLGWAVTMSTHWFVNGRERRKQRERLEAIRRSGPRQR